MNHRTARDLVRLPASWKWTTINELTAVVRGASPRPKGDPTYFGGPIPWIMIADVTRQPGKYLFNTREGVTHAGAEKSRIISSGNLILSNSGSVCIPKILKINGCIHDGFLAFPDLARHAHLDFAYYWFDYIRPKVIQENRQGITQVNLNTKIVGELHFPFAPPPEQHRIVAKLEELFSELDAGVAALRRAQRRLARYRQALLQAAVTGELTRERREQQARDIKLGKPASVGAPSWLPDSWDWTGLGEVGEVSGGITKNPRRESLPKRLSYLRVANVYADELRLQEVEEIGVQEGELPRALLQAGDLLVVEGNGSLDQIGRVAMWDGSISPCIHQNHLIKVRLGAQAQPRFAVLWLLSPKGRDAIVAQASSTSGLHTLSISKVANLPLPLPPLAEQEAIVAEFDRRNSLAQALEATFQASLRRAERLRQSILERAFRGELVPQDPNDEPAEALLARLKAAAPDTPAPRRRGRPPKAEPAEPQAPRRRGRPRKAAPLASGGSA